MVDFHDQSAGRVNSILKTIDNIEKSARSQKKTDQIAVVLQPALERLQPYTDKAICPTEMVDRLKDAGPLIPASRAPAPFQDDMDPRRYALWVDQLPTEKLVALTAALALRAQRDLEDAGF